MRVAIGKIIYKIMPMCLKEYIQFRLGDEQMEQQSQKDWYKARRAGYKRKDMSWYYAEQRSE